MSNPQEQPRQQVQTAPQAAPIAMPEQILDSATGVEGRVNEVAQTKASQQMNGQSTDDVQSPQKKDSAALAQDREALKQQLLRQAPREKEMRKDVQVALERRKVKLEASVQKFRSQRNYHKLSLAIMQLREVIRQLEELARMGYEALEGLWLKLIHKFA